MGSKLDTVDDDYVPQQIPNLQKHGIQKGQMIYELNLRLSYLTFLNGPSFATPQYRSIR